MSPLLESIRLKLGVGAWDVRKRRLQEGVAIELNFRLLYTGLMGMLEKFFLGRVR